MKIEPAAGDLPPVQWNNLLLAGIYAFPVNGVWELGQCLLLFDMSGVPLWQTVSLLWIATIGDMVAVVLILMISNWLANRLRLGTAIFGGYLVIISVGLLAGILLEWIALRLSLWQYNDVMPVLELFGESVGIAPVIQMACLPAFCWWLALRHSRRHNAPDVYPR